MINIFGFVLPCQPCIQIQIRDNISKSSIWPWDCSIKATIFHISNFTFMSLHHVQLDFGIQLTVEETIRACTVQCSLSFFVHKVHEGQQRCTGAGAPWSSPTSMLHRTLAPWSIFNLYVSRDNLTHPRLQVLHSTS